MGSALPAMTIEEVAKEENLVRAFEQVASNGGAPGPALDMVFEIGTAVRAEAVLRAKIARVEIRLRSLQMANYRTLAGAQLGKAPGPESSILKLRGSELQQQAYELAMEVMGHDSLSWFNEAGAIPALEDSVPSMFNYSRATTIYGGSSEVQKNIIAKLILGLA